MTYQVECRRAAFDLDTIYVVTNLTGVSYGTGEGGVAGITSILTFSLPYFLFRWAEKPRGFGTIREWMN